MEAFTKGLGRNALLFVTLLFFVGAVLQFVGFVTPGWVVWKDTDYTLERGIWYYKECINSTCSTKSYDSDQTDEDLSGVSRKMTTYQIRTSIGLAFTIADAVFMTMSLKYLAEGKRWAIHLLVLVINLTGGGVGGTSFSAAISFGIEVKDSHDSLGDASMHESPYGLYLTGIGASLAILAGITLFSLMMYACCCAPKEDCKDDRQVGNSYELPPKY